MAGPVGLPPVVRNYPAGGDGLEIDGGGAAPGGSAGVDFGEALKGALGDAGAAERTADQAAQKFAAGDPSVGIHEVMIAAEKASISLRYAVTLKNKLVEAYRELMNTQS